MNTYNRTKMVEEITVNLPAWYTNREVLQIIRQAFLDRSVSGWEFKWKKTRHTMYIHAISVINKKRNLKTT